ncbi:hypothetical protein [Fulvivirga lutea]|uniref:Outer membrane protein beta-barrel domain-containing protein n=1 Tax=Fulvivirga lutea TaxID=2810512 RepID=A0A974WDP1_9BACT|nr:hypothetical protein [Fulvivirga lutea]QSE96209.1 hypothetical protein JR347_11360 [Fulvivirga lutea]
MIKKVFYTALFCIIAHLNTAQNVFKSDFIITNEYDSIFGLIEIIKPNKLIQFETNKTYNTYGPDQIKRFGLKDGTVFSTEIISEQFVNVLIEGKLSLYSSKESYILIKEGQKDPYILNKETKDNKWKGYLSYMTRDCLSSDQFSKLNLRLTSQKLYEISKAYNICDKSNYISYLSDNKWMKINYGLSLGMVNSIIKVGRKDANSNHLPDKYSSIDPTIGIMFEFSTQNQQRSTYQIEMIVSKSDFYNHNVISTHPINFENNETYLEFTTLSFPITYRYYLNDKNNFYFNLGLINDIQLSSRSYFRSETVASNDIFVKSEAEAINSTAYQAGLLAGIGYKLSYNKLNYELRSFYSMSTKFNSSGRFNSNFNKIYISLIVSK